MGKGSRLFRFRRGIDRSWQLVADLGGWKIRQIGRLAIDPQQHGLALVGR